MKLNREVNLNELEKVAGGTYDPQNSFYKFITEPCRIRKKAGLNAHIIFTCAAALVVHAGPAVYNNEEGTTWYPVDLPLCGYVLASEVVPCDASEY